MSTIDEYIRLASDWGSAMDEGDSDKANLLHDHIQKLFEHIRETQNEWALFEQAGQVGDEACFFIASHLKDRDKARAIALYSRLEQSSKPFVAVSAKYILKELKGGKYLPPGS